jgi:hypothetical protein
MARQVDRQHAVAVMGEVAVCKAHTEWSFCAPWMKTTAGSAG